jgi:hypothetical protein
MMLTTCHSKPCDCRQHVIQPCETIEDKIGQNNVHCKSDLFTVKLSKKSH